MTVDRTLKRQRLDGTTTDSKKKKKQVQCVYDDNLSDEDEEDDVTAEDEDDDVTDDDRDDSKARRRVHGDKKSKYSYS